MRRSGGRPDRALATLLVLTLAATACSSGDGGTATPRDTSVATSAGSPDGRWVVTDDGGAVVVEADSYRLEVSDQGTLSIVLPDGDDPDAAGGVGAYIVRDGARRAVTGVGDAKPGLDHVTLFVTFADGTTGRIEIGAATPDTIAVAVTADDPSGVTSQGIDLEPSAAPGTYRLVGLPTLDP